jgi:hypothetical protein
MTEMDRLPPDMIRAVLRACVPRDAHYLAQTCTQIRRCVSEEELHRYRCGVVQYRMLCKRYHWSQYPERWNNRKECPWCHSIMQSQRNYDRHVTACKILGPRQVLGCRWCHIRVEGNHPSQCPLRPDVKCGNHFHGFVRCDYQGNGAQVEYHRKRCKITCEKCGKRCSMQRAKYHGNIVSDRCDGMIYHCPKCRQPFKGAFYGSHQPCLPDLLFHKPGSKSSVSRR